MKRVAYLIGLLLCMSNPAWAQVFVVTNCSQVPSPVEGQTFCFEGSTNTLKKYQSAAWVEITGSGYNRIQDEGSNLAQEVIVNFTGAGVTCTAESGKTTCAVSAGGSTHQVNGTPTTSNDPINFRTTSSITATNPSAGNVDLFVGADAIGNTHIADGAIAAAKITGTAVTQSRSITTSSPLSGGGTLSSNLTIGFANQSANQIFSGPTSGGAAVPTFRGLVDADIPAAITRDSEVNVQGTANEIASTGAGVAPQISIPAIFRITGKTVTAPIKTGTSLPATCTVGDYFFKTDATAGQNTYGCTATNTWTTQGAGTGVFSNTSNTYTGTTVQDFSASTTTLRLPLKTMPGSPTIGELMIDGANLYWRDNSGTPTTQRAIKATEMDAASGVAALDSNARVIARLQEYTVTTLPASPGHNRIVIVTDSTTAGDCTIGGGSVHSLCRYNSGSALWSSLSGAGGGAQGLDANHQVDNRIRSANSTANAVFIGSDNGLNGMIIYTDESTGPTFTCVVDGVVNDCDKNVRLLASRQFGVMDSSGNDIFIVDEVTGAISYPTTAKRPRKWISVSTSALARVDGTHCQQSEQQLGGGPRAFVMRCADNDSGEFEFSINFYGSKWDGSVLKVRLFGTHGTTETITWASDLKALCRGLGDGVNNTWSSTVNLDVSITTANLRVASSEVDLTPNGSCAADDKVFFHGKVDATTMSANGANFNVEEIQIGYLVSGE